jgi:hypothetical protein
MQEVSKCFQMFIGYCSIYSLAGNLMSAYSVISIISRKTASAACTRRSLSICSTCLALYVSAAVYLPGTEACRSAASTNHSKSSASQIYFRSHTTVMRLRPANQKACRSDSLPLFRAIKSDVLIFHLRSLVNTPWCLVETLHHLMERSCKDG